jgi:hypothetical protein
MQAIQVHPEFAGLFKLVAKDLEARHLLADWLEDHDQPLSAAKIRAVEVNVCKECHGTGKIKNLWLTVWPHQGEPCGGCVAGKFIPWGNLRQETTPRRYATLVRAGQ